MRKEAKVVASGTWLYDGSVPHRIDIYSLPAELAGSRFDEDDQLDPTTPIPQTPDGNVYRSTFGREQPTLEEAMAWADAQPWGPVKWDPIK
jgi:hypothetical protein